MHLTFNYTLLFCGIGIRQQAGNWQQTASWELASDIASWELASDIASWALASDSKLGGGVTDPSC
jgi:hypothetical protein